jgi:hypothetical protein
MRNHWRLSIRPFNTTTDSSLNLLLGWYPPTRRFIEHQNLGSATEQRASATSCFCPVDRLTISPSWTSVAYPSGNPAMNWKPDCPPRLRSRNPLPSNGRTECFLELFR